MRHATTVLIVLVGVLIAGCYKAGERSEIKATNRIDEESRDSPSEGNPRTGVEAYMDVRGHDLHACDLRGAGAMLYTLTFNEKTLWPPRDRLPEGFDPECLLQESMNPGLGVQELHRQGITGKGVNVAIIDQPMYLTHPEFAGKVAAYHDVGCRPQDTIHGTAVTSLLVGTHCGTAPEARVFYVAAPSWTGNSAYYAEALEWIMEYNHGLPDSERIRVVSVSARPSGPESPFKKNRAQWDKAFERAQKEGILVLDASHHKGFISACWCDPNDPENPAKCTPGYPGLPDRYNPANLMAPTSLRTVARQDKPDCPSYQYYGRGGLSWGIPYVAGVLAMGWQVRPELSPEQIKELLFQSAFTNDKGEKIINPKAFIRMVQTANIDSLHALPEDALHSK
jgi:serine protease AprX